MSVVSGRLGDLRNQRMRVVNDVGDLWAKRKGWGSMKEQAAAEGTGSGGGTGRERKPSKRCR